MTSGISRPARGRRMKEDKVCGVCGDKALGYNFDAICCESCKAFFRRNALKGADSFKCAYDERCSLDTANRRFCKKCRLTKCFAIGMRKEYIMTDEEKASKRQKIYENRLERKIPSPLQWEAKLELELELDVSSESQTPSIQTVTLSVEDTNAIEELMVSYCNSLEINMDKDPPRDSASFSDLVNIAELSVRRVIAMAKQIGAFKRLPQADQIHLLKGGSIELLIIRSVITFDKDKQHFLDPSDAEETKAMNVEQLRQAEHGTGLFDEHMKFVRSLAIDLKADVTTLILLLVISLFSPDRGDLVREDLVAEQQEWYSRLLYKYLMSQHPEETVRTLYPKLLMKLTDIRNLNEEHSQVLLRVNPEGIQPLMQEVLDL